MVYVENRVASTLLSRKLAFAVLDSVAVTVDRV